MLTVLLHLFLAGAGAPEAEAPQLLVSSREDVASCRAAPPEWDSRASFDVATPEAVSADLGRYFAGLSFQATSIFGAARTGLVRFCDEADEAVVLEALVELVIRPLRVEAALEPRLELGAAWFVEGLASPALAAKLRAIKPADDDEARRRDLALDLVRAKRAARNAPP